MNKSEIFNMAMLAVVNCLNLSGEEKLVVIEKLMNEKHLAEMFEKMEEEK